MKRESRPKSANSRQEKYNRLRERTQAETHVRDLVEYLWTHGTITSYECFEKLNNTRVSSTVSILRHDYDVPVNMVMVQNGRKRYGQYSIDCEAYDVQM